MKENIQFFEDFKDWCYNMGEKASNPETLSEFISKFDGGEIVKCDCCGQFFDEEHSHFARYDFDKIICPDCREDGN